MKFNKELLIKHRFWILVAIALVMTFGGIFYLQFSVEADTTKTVKDINEAKKVKGEHNDETVKVRAGYAGQAQKSESEVWSEAFKVQEPLYTWAAKLEEEFQFTEGLFANDIRIDKAPANVKDWPGVPSPEGKKDPDFVMYGSIENVQPDFLELQNRKGEKKRFYKTELVDKAITVVGQPAKVQWGRLFDYISDDPKNVKEPKLAAIAYQKGKFFGDALTLNQQRAYAESYRQQLTDLLKIVDPLDDKGNGVVQLKSWLYRPDALPTGSVRFLRFVDVDWKTDKNFSEEAWLAQENVWIQREIYSVIRSANDKISKFDGTGGEERNKPYTFSNAFFTITLKLDVKGALHFEIKNRTPKRQRIDLAFKIVFDKSLPPENIKVSGPPLMPAGSENDSWKHDPIPATGPRKGIISIDQVLTWDSAAVRRIDHISIGADGQEETSHGHRTSVEVLKAFDPDAGVAAPGPGAAGKPKTDGGLLDAGGGAVPKGLEHGMWRERYVAVTQQSRRIPVAIVLIVGQDHVDRVLTRFNNSRLRFLTTQVLVNHYTGSLQPPAIEQKGPEAGTPPMFPFGKGGIGSIGPSQPPAGGSPGQTQSANDLEANMELVIYGVMTLYQRYPTRPAPKLP